MLFIQKPYRIYVVDVKINNIIASYDVKNEYEAKSWANYLNDFWFSNDSAIVIENIITKECTILGDTNGN